MSRTAIRITRPYAGIGDWLMSLACCKLVNRQRPDIDIYVDFAAASGLPLLVREAFAASDVRYLHGKGPSHARATMDSLVYRRYPPENYIESMLIHLNDQTGLDIEYEHGIFPDFNIRRDPGNYIVMIGQGKRRERHRKEWGVRNLVALASALTSAGHEVQQIGRQGDFELPGTTRCMTGRRFTEVASVLAGARAYIGLENGIMMLAGFLGVPQVTIYDGHSRPNRVSFDNHLKIAERIEPDEAAPRILKWIQNN